MEAVISIVGSLFGSLVGKAAEYTVDPIAQQLSYLFKHKSKFQKLRNKVQELKDARERVQQSVIDANRNGEEIFGDVDRWLTVVNGKISEQAATKLQEDEEAAMKRCFAGFCPIFKSRYQLSKKAETEANTIAKLLNQNDRFDRVSYTSAPEGIGLRLVKEYEAFESRSRVLNGVMEALKDDSFNIIGVHGMGGVGKTTLVKEVAKQAKEKQMFDEVVFVPITQTPNSMLDIQNEIAEKLDLKIHETNMDVRAARLHNSLKKKGKVLIVLDDVWKPLDLEALGIPSRGENMGCKILVTSRNLDVLKLMDSHKYFAVDILKEDEAWNLFKNMAGDIVERSDLQSTAIEVAQKCAGLPIAIATVAKALKHKENLFEWKNALRELRRPSGRNFKGIPADAYSAIEFSYRFLEVEEHQPIFLLCSIMGHNAAIEDLLRYGMGLGLFHDVYTMEETRDKVLTLVSNLKASCLLLDGSNQKHFDMHDVVRDVAISIASRDHHWLALGRDDVFKDWSDEEKMKNYNLINLQYAQVSELLDHELGCPNLTFFSMGSEDSFLQIPNNFFKRMLRLRVLNFARMHFSSLPSSIGSLKTLFTLCLLDCDLEDIVIIGELENLEVLSLRRSRIAMLPREIGQLTRLKLLDLSDCYDLQVISPNVLSSLSRLEELYLYNSFDRWVVEGNDNPRSNASLVELQHLSHLTTLELHIPNEQVMPKGNIFSGKLERYKISIGMEWECWDNRMETSRMLKLKMNKSIHMYDGVQALLRNTESLYINGVKDVMNMLYEPIIEGLPQIKHLHVSDVSEIKFVINSMKWASCKVFPLLESLFLYNLINLEATCFDQLKAESFGRLKVIKVEKCNMLKNLFSFSIARELRQLQEIEVSDCENITELIVEKRDEEIAIGDNEVNYILEFSQLRSLRLKGLPSFIGLFCSEKKLSSSQQGRVQSDASLLFDQKVVLSAIEELRLDSISSIEKLWHDHVPVMSFGVQNLTSLNVSGCHKLKYLFSSRMVKSLVQLKRLFVEDCDEMEEVIAVTERILGDEEERIGSIMLFPKLEYLELWRLPNLKRFCCGNPVEFLVLRTLRIIQCPILSAFHCVGKSSNNISMMNTDIPHCLFNEMVVFHAIKELGLESINSIERLWHDQLPAMAFGVQNLTNLEVLSCNKLKYLFSSCMVKSLEQLKRLAVEECDEMEEIIAVTEGILGGEERMVFPKLAYLHLYKLPNLKRFCRGINPIEFPLLKELTTSECPVLSTFHCDSSSVGKNSNGSISMDHNLNTDVPVPRYLFNEKVALPMIHLLYIHDMENLERLWPNYQLAEDSFSKLNYFTLIHCDKLLNVFPLSMSTRFQRLDQITIRGCKLLEEIFESQQEGGSARQSLSPQLIQSTVITFEFPRVKSLELKRLPKLKCFYHSIHATNWPSLKEMEVYGCDKIEILFASQETDGKSQHGIPIHQPLFWVNKFTFPNLQQLSLGRNDGMKEIWHCYGQQLPSDYFCSLKVVKLHHYPRELSIFPSYLFQLFSLPILETLEISSSFFKEIFQREGVGGEEKPAWVLSRLSELRLENLQELITLWKEEEGFQNLGTLLVQGCPKLKFNLVPSSVSFQNLVTLKVRECYEIKKLVTHSTAKSLVQLREMSIFDCRMIEEIIESEDDDHDDDEISFPQLNLLVLHSLPKLESFCSSMNCAFGFPSLEVVIVEDCPKMKMFSQGESNTPMLRKVQLKRGNEEEGWNWEGSLNSTIQQLFKERNRIKEVQSSMKDQGNPSTSNTK